MPRWMLWSVLALFSWGVWAILPEFIGKTLSAAHKQALSTIGFVPVLVALGLLKKPPPSGIKRWGILFAMSGGTLSCLGNVAYFDALGRGGKAATVVPLTALYPLVTITLALLFLKERLNRIQLGGLLLSLVAIYLFNVRSEEGFLSTWLAYALVPIALWGVAGFLQKLSTNHISGELSALWFLGVFIPITVVILSRDSLPEEITPRTWMLVTAIGFSFALGNLAILAAFASHGKASIITPLTALYPVVSVPIAIYFLGNEIGNRETAGIGLALLSVAALSFETRPVEPVKATTTPHTPTNA